MVIAINIVQGILLGILCLEDLKNKQISMLLTFAFGICSLLYGFLKLKNGTMTFFEMCLGIGTGFILLGISVLSREQIGVGDGIISILLGASYGLNNITILCVASILASVYGLFLLIRKKADKKTTMPFVPAITLGYVVNMFLR